MNFIMKSELTQRNKRTWNISNYNKKNNKLRILKAAFFTNKSSNFYIVDSNLMIWHKLKLKKSWFWISNEIFFLCIPSGQLKFSYSNSKEKYVFNCTMWSK